jgi:hypothetical protein
MFILEGMRLLLKLESLKFKIFVNKTLVCIRFRIHYNPESVVMFSPLCSSIGGFHVIFLAGGYHFERHELLDVRLVKFLCSRAHYVV